MIASPALETTRDAGHRRGADGELRDRADEVEDLVQRSCELATDDEVAGLVESGDLVVVGVEEPKVVLLDVDVLLEVRHRPP